MNTRQTPNLPFEPSGERRGLWSLCWTSGLLRINLFLLSGGKTGDEGLVLLLVGLGFLTNDDKGTVAFSGWCFELIGELLRFGRCAAILMRKIKKCFSLLGSLRCYEFQFELASVQNCAQQTFYSWGDDVSIKKVNQLSKRYHVTKNFAHWLV